MGKYEFGKTVQVSERHVDIHPIWRGIGCVLMALIPVLSYAAAGLLVQENLRQGWLPMSANLVRPVFVPFIGNVPFLFANLLATVLLSLVGFSLMTIFFSVIRTAGGVSSYGEMDAPPVRQSPRKRPR
jgi:hypothetical protein